MDRSFLEKNELNIISSKTDFEGLNNDIVYQRITIESSRMLFSDLKKLKQLNLIHDESSLGVLFSLHFLDLSINKIKKAFTNLQALITLYYNDLTCL